MLDLAEAGHYSKRAPNGFAAALAKGQVPDWLGPVAIDGPAVVQDLARDPLI